MSAYTNKFWFHHLVVVFLVVAVSGIGFSARERSEERGREKSKERPAAVSQRSESPAKAQTRSAKAPARSESRQAASQTRSRPQRQSSSVATPQRAAATQNNTRSAQAAPSTRSASSTRQAQSARSSNQRVSQSAAPKTASQPASQKRAAAPARRVNRTVEVVSTAKTNRSVTPQAVSQSSTRVSRTVVTSKAPEKARTVAAPSVKSKDVQASRLAQTRSVAPQTKKVQVVQPVRAPSVKPVRTKTVERAAVVNTAGTSFDFYGAASNRTKTKQLSSRPVQKRTAVRDVHPKTAAPVRVTVNDIKAAPKRVVVSDIRSRPSVRDLDRKKTTRIHSEASREHKASRTSSMTTTRAASTVDVQQNLSRSDRRTSGRHDRPGKSSSSSQIIINNDNRVIVQGSATRHRPRPNISRHLFRDVSRIRSDRHWVNRGSSFYFGWSSSSYGVAVCLPYYYSSVYYGSPRYGISYYYPNYHRKYVFVSLGGYWPHDYRYRRYYWYGCHPHYWYGSRVIYEPSRNVTYNTYNYYDTDKTANSDGYGFSSSSQPYYTLGNPKEDAVDEPQFQTPADLCFDNAVTLFAAAKYDEAVEQFREAVLLSPDDIIVPFTYSQALFAVGDYARAAGVLRAALDTIPDDELTIYFPRGLYEDETVLNKQIEQLRLAAEKEPFASDYQLLLGYQYLGMNKLDKAALPLAKAAQSSANAAVAGKLIELAGQLEKEETP